MGYLMFQEVILMSKTVATPREESEFTATAVRVSRLSVWGNAILTLFKLFAGIIAHSGAMISDAVHSASDVLSSFIVIIGVRLAAQDSDAEHPYGHEKFESVAAVILAVILCVTGLFIGRSAIEKLRGNTPEALVMPGALALVAAVVSIVVKEAMYRYTRHFAKKIDSPALMAEAWHHRSDALSSLGTTAGIGGAIVLGEAWRVLDPLAAVVVSVLILKVAMQLFVPSMEELLEKSLPDEEEKEIRAVILEQPGCTDPHNLRTRRIGNYCAIDVHFRMDGRTTIDEAHRATREIEDRLRERFGSQTLINTHVEPVKPPVRREAE